MTKPYTPEFEYFWRVYPKRWDRNRSKMIKRKKFPAWESWLKLDDETHHDILTKTKYIKDFEGGAVRDAVTWLNQRGWDDITFPGSWVPVLPPELTKDVLKTDIKTLDVNERRNAIRKGLKVK